MSCRAVHKDPGLVCLSLRTGIVDGAPLAGNRRRLVGNQWRLEGNRQCDRGIFLLFTPLTDGAGELVPIEHFQAVRRVRGIGPGSELFVLGIGLALR